MASAADRFAEAVALIEKGQMDVIPLITAAEALAAAGAQEQAVILYKTWLLANQGHPLWHLVSFNCGASLLSRGDCAGASELLALAIAVKPDYYPARLNRGSALERSGDKPAALAEWEQVVTRLAEVSQANIGFKVMALKNIARVHPSVDARVDALRQAIEINPAARDLVQGWINERQVGCIWPVLEPVGSLTIRDLLRIMAPLSMSVHLDDPWLLKACARNDSSSHVASGLTYLTLGNWPQPRQAQPEKLRIGYLSSDFCNHAVGYLISDTFQFHNRARYELTVFNTGKRTGDAIERTIMANVDHWLDVGGSSDREAAETIVGSGIDILLDMNGHTSHMRTRVLALKPAPIIVNWLGYPGTMGTAFHHYILADEFIIPQHFEMFYTEKVLRLPCYQPNRQLHPVPESPLTRADLGLPDNATVFCCFNSSKKISESVFSRWMKILAQVPDSVLWLLGGGAQLGIRLRSEAEKRGIRPERLVFLGNRSNIEYLACHRYADIFLDTFPYGAHTTASDSLRMAVPIVTLAGKGFPSRVCGSLLQATGMDELICTTADQYMALAVELGNNRARTAELKKRLQARLPTCTLFDTRLLVRHLEALFEQVWQDYCSGRLPRPNFCNLEDYLDGDGQTLF